MIRENCREDEDYRLVEEDGKKGLDGNTRQQSKRCHMNKGGTRMAHRGALRVGDAVSVCPWFGLLSFWSSANH